MLPEGGLLIPPLKVLMDHGASRATQEKLEDRIAS